MGSPIRNEAASSGPVSCAVMTDQVQHGPSLVLGETGKAVGPEELRLELIRTLRVVDDRAREVWSDDRRKIRLKALQLLEGKIVHRLQGAPSAVGVEIMRLILIRNNHVGSL